MKLLYAVFCFAVATSTATSQESSGKKTMVFQPGSKVPEGHAPGEIDAASPHAPEQFANQFFLLLQKGDVEAAYQGLTKGSKIAERPEESKALKAKTREALDVFGAVVGFELVESTNVGKRLLRRTYVSIGKDFPLRWRFYFYKPEETWRLVDLRVDDRLAGIFDEAEETRPADARP